MKRCKDCIIKRGTGDCYRNATFNEANGGKWVLPSAENCSNYSPKWYIRWAAKIKNFFS